MFSNQTKMFSLPIKLTHPTSVALKYSISTQDQDVIFETINNAGIITLNRPKALNSLTPSIVTKVYTKLKEWQNQKSVVIIKGAGDKAFSAGGDIKLATDPIEGKKLFHTVYNVSYLVNTYKIPYIALMNGLAMGGGLSLCANGRYAVAMEKTMTAMPETKIGLIPDVGASYFLSRLENKLGFYLGLTGERLKGKDVVRAGLATHFVPGNQLSELEVLLSQCKNDLQINTLLNKYHKPCADFSLANNIKHIEYCFGAATVEEIIQRLEKIQNGWSEKTLKTLHQMCPGSLKMTLLALQRGSQMDLGECLKMEYRLSCRAFRSHDFPEGVRALLVDKDNNPKWKPATLADVTDDYIQSFFTNLPPDQELQIFDDKL